MTKTWQLGLWVPLVFIILRNHYRVKKPWPTITDSKSFDSDQLSMNSGPTIKSTPLLMSWRGAPLQSTVSQVHYHIPCSWLCLTHSFNFVSVGWDILQTFPFAAGFLPYKVDYDIIILLTVGSTIYLELNNLDQTCHIERLPFAIFSPEWNDILCLTNESHLLSENWGRNLHGYNRNGTLSLRPFVICL